MNVAVVGVGHLGTFHARTWAGLDGARLVAVVDIDADRGARLAEELGVSACTDWREMPAAVEAVSLAVPTDRHAELGVEILGSGRHLLVEKPIASTLAEADRLVDAARRADRVLMVGHTERFNPAVAVMRREVIEPRFLEAQRMASFVPRSLDVDVVLDLMIHDLDLALLLAGSEVTEVRAIGVNAFTDKIDIANARIRFASGCVANLTASRVSRDRVRKLRIFQPNRYLSLDFSARTLVSCRIDPAAAGLPTLAEENLPIPAGDALGNQLTSFAAAVCDRTPPGCSGEEGRRALALALQVIDELET